MPIAPGGPPAAPALPAPARAALAALRARPRAPAPAPPPLVAWAPGRVNLIGEHTDYNDGWVLPFALDRAVALAAQRLPGTTARLHAAHFGEEAAIPITPAGCAALAVDPTLPRWARFVAAALAELGARVPERPLPAFEAVIVGDVPVGGGMSSSAALIVAALMLGAALLETAIPPSEVARLAQRAEQRASGARVGLMDQMSACLGRVGFALLLDCRSGAHEYVALDLPGLAFAAFDTGVPHALAESAYNQRREECERAVALLAPAIARADPTRQIRALRDLRLADFEHYGALLPDPLPRRARHVVTENQRVRRAVKALRARDIPALGPLLVASHVSLRDDYAVSCPELDAAVELAVSVPGVVGARMMGAGFGGSALILAEQTVLPALEATLARDYPPRTGRHGTFMPCQSADGAACRPAPEVTLDTSDQCDI
ncbi:MAG TPA: galactokinase [Ktedonobacterales bacterium]